MSREPHGREAPIYRELTVAQIRKGEGTAHTEVLFLESARIYKLIDDRSGSQELLERLQRAAMDGRAVSVGFRSLESDVIEDVRAS